MKILVLGDSFAAHHQHQDSWTQILKQKSNFEIDVLAVGGQSFYYCYYQLKRIKKEYDFYIILTTEPGRIFVNEDIGYSCNTAARASNDLEKAADQFFNFLFNNEYSNDVHIWTINAIKDLLKDKKYYFIPCCINGNIGLNKDGFNLLDIKLLEDKFIPKELIAGSESYRINHLFPENNKILADYFLDIITKGSSTITINDFVPPPKEFWLGD